MLAVRRAETDDELRDVIAVRSAVHPEAEPTLVGFRPIPGMIVYRGPLLD